MIVTGRLRYNELWIALKISKLLQLSIKWLLYASKYVYKVTVHDICFLLKYVL